MQQYLRQTLCRTFRRNFSSWTISPSREGALNLTKIRGGSWVQVKPSSRWLACVLPVVVSLSFCKRDVFGGFVQGVEAAYRGSRPDGLMSLGRSALGQQTAVNASPRIDSNRCNADHALIAGSFQIFSPTYHLIEHAPRCAWQHALPNIKRFYVYFPFFSLLPPL